VGQCAWLDFIGFKFVCGERLAMVTAESRSNQD
jgi:hypothetical protein